MSKHMHTVQFCRPLACTFDHLYREVANPGGGGNLSELGRDELILLSCLLQQHWLNLAELPRVLCLQQMLLRKVEGHAKALDPVSGVTNDVTASAMAKTAWRAQQRMTWW